MLTSTCVSRRLHSLVLPQTTLHEPLLFLYPRWFAQETCKAPTTRRKLHSSNSSAAEDRQILSKSGNINSGHSSKQHLQNAADAKEKGPSIRLVKGVAGLPKAEGQKRINRQQLRTKQSDSQDWKTPLSWLKRWTLEGERNNGKRTIGVFMPKGAYAVYPADIGQLFLEIMLMTDCHVELSEKERDGGGITGFKLTGTPQSIALARARLNDAMTVVSVEDPNASRDLATYTLRTTVERLERPTLRTVWTTDNKRRKARSVDNLKDLPKPESWTIISFANYVKDIVDMDPPRLLQRKIYNSTDDQAETNRHVQAATQLLGSLFTIPQLQQCISPYACVSAFSFLAHNRKIPNIRRIFGALDESDIALTPEVFHVLMRASVESQDLHNYQYLLQLMVRRNIQPTWATWAALVRLMAGENIRTAKYITQAMRHKGILVNPAAKQAVAEALIGADYRHWLGSGATTELFLQHYDRLWTGPEWLSDSCANSMLKTLADRGQFADAQLIVDELKRRGGKAKITNLNTVLSSCVRQGDYNLAMAFTLKFLADSTAVEPDKITFHELFRLAWNGLCFNLLRVVWRYACMSGHVSFRMEHTMKQGIFNFAHSRPNNHNGIDPTADEANCSEQFRSLAAMVAVGVSPLQLLEKAAAPLYFREEYLLQHGTEEAPAETERADAYWRLRRKRLQSFVKADLSQVGQMRPLEPLGRMLMQAWELDRRAKTEGLVGDIQALLDRAIEVPVGQGSLTTPRRIQEDRSI